MFLYCVLVQKKRDLVLTDHLTGGVGTKFLENVTEKEKLECIERKLVRVQLPVGVSVTTIIGEQVQMKQL